MKALKYSLFIFLIATMVSCSKFLDVDPEESISDNQTIFDKTSAEQYVVSIMRCQVVIIMEQASNLSLISRVIIFNGPDRSHKYRNLSIMM